MTVVLITGAGSGIGLATASVFAENGDQVYAGVRNLNHIPSELDHPCIHPLKLDVTSEADISVAMDEMATTYGLPNILINNAGINLPGTVEETSQDSWEQVFKVNFFAPITLCQKLLPHMRQSGNGCIIMLSSLSADIGLPYDGPYAASKAALNRAAECLASEVKPFGIRIIIVEPGAVNTKLMSQQGEIDNPLPDYRLLNDHMQARTAANDRGENPRVIAEEILLLADNPNAALVCPIGKQAREITGIVKHASSLERERIIRDASGLAWWINQNRKH